MLPKDQHDLTLLDDLLFFSDILLSAHMNPLFQFCARHQIEAFPSIKKNDPGVIVLLKVFRLQVCPRRAPALDAH